MSYPVLILFPSPGGRNFLLFFFNVKVTILQSVHKIQRSLLRTHCFSLSLSLSLSLIHRSLIVLLWSSLLFCMFVRFWESRAQACHVFFHGRLMHANYKEQRVVDMSSIVAFCDWFFEAAMLLTYNSHKVIRPLTIVWAYMQPYAHYAQYTACFAGCEKPARRYHHPSQAKIRPDWAFPYVAGGWLANRHLVTGGSLSGRNSVTKWDELVSLTQLDSARLSSTLWPFLFPQLVGTPHHLSIFEYSGSGCTLIRISCWNSDFQRFEHLWM